MGGWIFLYVCIALGFMVFDVDDAILSFLGLKNPLWKLPMTVVWPVSFVVVIFAALWLLLSDYVTEIRDYYKDRRDREE